MEKQMYQIGQDVTVEMIGTIKAIETDYLGNLKYIVEGNYPKSGYVRCYVNQSMVCRLPEPADFKEVGNGN